MSAAQILATRKRRLELAGVPEEREAQRRAEVATQAVAAWCSHCGVGGLHSVRWVGGSTYGVHECLACRAWWRAQQEALKARIGCGTKTSLAMMEPTEI